MPTMNPRINVTLPTSLDQLVGRMAAHTRVSKSQVLRELLEAAEPALQRAVALMDAATVASAEARAGLAHQMGRGVEHAEDAMAVILSRLDRATGDLVSQAEAVRGKRPARGERLAAVAAGRTPRAASAAAENPPASNRGVKSPAKSGKQATPLRARRGSA
jgi:hypothetical protein